MLYKVMRDDGTTAYGRDGWDLPRGSRRGSWRRVTGPLIPCENGLHVCREQDLISWIQGERLYEAEARGDQVDGGDKLVVREARLVRRVAGWNETTLRLFAADCAERALLGEQKAGREPDRRLWAAVKAARDYAHGLISQAELAAARAAAWAAAGAAARDAAWDAVGAAAGAAAWDAAWDAAGAAAGAAAWYAVGAAAGAAEREWQSNRLSEYLSGKRGTA